MVAVPDLGDWSPVGLNGAVRGNKLGMNHVDSRLGNVVVGVCPIAAVVLPRWTRNSTALLLC